MMWADDLSDPRELRNYIRDLIALSALPATWKAYEPQRIAESVAAAMIAMLSLRTTEPGTSEQTITDPSGGDQLWIVSAPVGSGGTLVAGSLRPGFPSNKDRLLVASAASEITIAFNLLQSSSSQSVSTDRSKEVADAVARVKELSPRGRQILEALTSGHANKVIAYDLGISERTVEVHRARMMKQLGVHHLSEAIRIALLAGWRTA